MRFEHGSLLRTECLAAALIIALLLLLLCRCGGSVPPFRTFRECLHLDASVGPWDACGPDVRLRFCDAYEPRRLLAARCDRRGLERLRQQDERAREAACRFRHLVDRYDCENANSVSWTCKDCEEVYKQWVCAMFLPPVLVEGEGVKPCRYICRLVEQRCPYFHPSVKDQYAGERVFKCIDPDIPDLDSIQGLSSYGPPNRCYCPQHLGSDQPPSSDEEAECRMLTQAQLRRHNASSRHSTTTTRHHRSDSGKRVLSNPPMTLLAATVALLWLWAR